MFELIEDYTSGDGKYLTKGEYSKEDLIEIFGNEGTFNFLYNCTNLKYCLKEKKTSLKNKIINKIEEFAEEISNPILDTSNLIYIVNEDIKKGNKIVFKKDDKVTLKELENVLGERLDQFFDKLEETKTFKDEV